MLTGIFIVQNEPSLLSFHDAQFQISSHVADRKSSSRVSNCFPVSTKQKFLMGLTAPYYFESSL